MESYDKPRSSPVGHGEEFRFHLKSNGKPSQCFKRSSMMRLQCEICAWFSSRG